MVVRAVLLLALLVSGLMVPPAWPVQSATPSGASASVSVQTVAPSEAVSLAVSKVRAGRLVVKVRGLPKKTTTRVVVTGPGGYRKVKRTRTGFTLKGLRAGQYGIAAGPVTTARAGYEAPGATATLSARSGASATVRFTRTVSVSAKTEVLTGAETRRLQEVTADRLVFEGTRTPATRGEFVVCGPTSVAPDGLLRRVVSVSKSGGDTVLRTEPARLTDVLQQASINVSGVPLDPGRTVTLGASGAAGIGASWYGQGQVGAPVTVSKSWSASSGGVGVSADVAVESGQSVDLGLGIERRGLTPVLTSYLTKVTMAQQVRATVGASAGGDATVSTRLPSVRLGQVTVMAGPVPVVFTFRLDPELRAGVGFGRTASATVTGSVTRTAEVFYRDGAWGGAGTTAWEAGGNATTGQWSGHVRGGLQADVAVSIYDLAGPMIGVETGLRANATPDSLDLATGRWELLGQGRADVGGKVSLFGIKDAALTIPIAQADWPITQGTWGTPVVPDSGLPEGVTMWHPGPATTMVPGFWSIERRGTAFLYASNVEGRECLAGTIQGTRITYEQYYQVFDFPAQRSAGEGTLSVSNNTLNLNADLGLWGPAPTGINALRAYDGQYFASDAGAASLLADCRTKMQVR